MAIIKQHDKRSGITYVYESVSFWDKDKHQSRSKRTLLGKLDPATGEVIPTDGRGRRRSPSYTPAPDEYIMPTTMKGLRSEVHRLLEENRLLKQQLEKYRSAKK